MKRKKERSGKKRVLERSFGKAYPHNPFDDSSWNLRRNSNREGYSPNLTPEICPEMYGFEVGA
jgi:hypothetical protein